MVGRMNKPGGESGGISGTREKEKGKRRMAGGLDMPLGSLGKFG